MVFEIVLERGLKFQLSIRALRHEISLAQTMKFTAESAEYAEKNRNIFHSASSASSAVKTRTHLSDDFLAQEHSAMVDFRVHFTAEQQR
jgi:hypothetical protein